MKNKTTFLLEIDTEIWEKFKSKVTKNKTLNEAIVDLIKNFCGEK
jgi:Txe/YoeB family toxin of Txe-Axe toxin-antitoxin module